MVYIKVDKSESIQSPIHIVCLTRSQNNNGQSDVSHVCAIVLIYQVSARTFSHPTTPYHLYRNDFLCMPEKKPPPLSLLVTYSHSEKMIGSQRCIIKNGKYQVASAQEVGRHSSCMRSVGTKKCCQRLIHHRLYQSQPSHRQAGRHYKNAQCTAVAVPQYVCSTVNMSSSLS